MSLIFAVIRREYLSFFRIPAGWFVIALMMLGTGLVFVFQILEPGREASLRPVLELNGWMLLFIAPALGMRTFSEEYRSETWYFLATSKLTNHQIVFSKFIATFFLLLTAIAPVLPCGIVLEFYSNPDWGECFSGSIGILLAGSVYASTSMLFSSCTRAQSVAFLGSIFFWMMLTLIARFAPPFLPDSLVPIVVFLDPTQKIVPFSLGLFDTANVVYLLGWIFVLLFLTVIVISFKRWTR